MSNSVERKRNIIDSVVSTAGNVVGGIAKTAHGVVGGAVDALANSGTGYGIAGAALQPLLQTEGYKDKQEERSLNRERRDAMRKSFAHDDWLREKEKELYSQSQEDRQRKLRWAEEDRTENKADRQQARQWKAEDRPLQVESNKLALQRQRMALDAARQDRKQQEIQTIIGNVRSRLGKESQDWNNLTLPEQDAFIAQNGPVKEYLEALWGARNLLKARDGDQQAWEDVTRELEDAGIGVVDEDGDYSLLIGDELMPLNEETVMAAIQQLEDAVAGELSVASQIGTHANGGMVMNGVMGEYVSEFAKYNGGVLAAAQKSFNDAYSQFTLNEKIYMALSKLSDKFSTAKDDEEKMSLWNQATPLLDRLGVQMKLGPTGQPYIYDERKTFGEREYSVEGFGQIMKQKDTGSQKLQTALKTQQTLAQQQEIERLRKMEKVLSGDKEPPTAIEQFKQQQARLGEELSQKDKSLDNLFQNTIAIHNIKNPGKEISRDDFNTAVGLAMQHALQGGGEDPQMTYKLYSNKLKDILGDMGVRVPKNFASEYEEKYLRELIIGLNKQMVNIPAGKVSLITSTAVTANAGVPMIVPDKNRQELKRVYDLRQAAQKRLKAISAGKPAGNVNPKVLERKKALFGL